MRNRLFVAGLAAPTALTLALALSACASSSTVDGQGGNGTSASTTPSASQNEGSSSGSAPSTSPSTSSNASPAVALTARLGQGLSQARTAHLSLNVSAAGETITGGGNEKLSNGKLVALDLSETVSHTLALRLIVVGGRTYVHLPSTLNKSGKPWQLVSAKSSNPTIRSLASSLSSTQTSASLANVTAFVSAARSVRQTASSGSSTTYAVDVNPAKLPATFPDKQALIGAGLTSIPVNIELDSAGRPVLVTEKLSVKGQMVSTKVTIGSYNKPVHITAPPASQVSTR